MFFSIGEAQTASDTFDDGYHDAHANSRCVWVRNRDLLAS